MFKFIPTHVEHEAWPQCCMAFAIRRMASAVKNLSSDLHRRRFLGLRVSRQRLRLFLCGRQIGGYGWNDLAATLNAVFLAKPQGDNGRGARAGAPEDEHTYQGRLFWPQAARDVVLARLLALNATRAAGLPDPTYGDSADTAEDAAE